MQITKRRIALASVVAMLLYLGPNLVQDVHRIFGHQIQYSEIQNQSGIQLYSQNEKCAVCVFEFNIVEVSKPLVFVPVLNIEKFILESLTENQIQNKCFGHYYLRGPPQA